MNVFITASNYTGTTVSMVAFVTLGVLACIVTSPLKRRYPCSCLGSCKLKLGVKENFIIIGKKKI